MHRAGVQRADGDVVEQAEAHCLVAFGMVARRADGTKGIVEALVRHQIDGIDHRPRSPERRLGRARAHDGVGVNMDVMFAYGLFRERAQDAVHEPRGMNPEQILARGLARLAAHQILERLLLQAVQHGPQPVGTFGMARWGLMVEAGWMADQTCRHCRTRMLAG